MEAGIAAGAEGAVADSYIVVLKGTSAWKDNDTATNTGTALRSPLRTLYVG